MDADLKPCPFCGENAAEANQETGDAGLVRHSIYCTVCMAEGPTTYRPDRAIERWNERAAGVTAGAESRVPELTREDFDPRNALEEMIVQRYMNKVPLSVIEVRNILTALRTDGVAPSQAPNDGFNGDTPHLINCMRALVNLNDAGALTPHGIGGHARTLLLAAAARLERTCGVKGPDHQTVKS